MRSGAALLAVLAALAGAAPAVALKPPPAVPGCAGVAAGGEWRSYGGGLDNARQQRAEHTISPANVGTLAPVWQYTTPDGGTFSTTPVVADGCVFLGSQTGKVTARNADTGKEIWSVDLATGSDAGAGIIGAPVVGDGLVYVGVNLVGAPFVVALDETTGRVRWRTTIEENPPASDVYVDASPVLFDGMVFMGFNGQETHDGSRGGYAILDARNGAMLAHRYTIPDERFAQGYEGASIWATPAIDPVQRYLYVGTGNPTGDHEDPYAQAMIKIDLDRRRPTFADIVGAHQGNTDRYLPGAPESPVCEQSLTWPLNRAGCLQLLDVDFGASPNLFDDGAGHLVMGELQKSGVYWAVDTATMKPLWSTTLSVPMLAFNLGSTAVDERNVYVGASGAGQLYALDKTTGAIKWATVVHDLVRFSSVSVANGVVYTVDGVGFVEAFDAATGLPLLKRWLPQDTQDSGYDAGNSVGISLARGRAYVATASHLIAYAPGGGT